VQDLFDPVKYAERWADAWNRRDLDEVLEHFDENIVLTSPTAQILMGHAVVRGKVALRAYWTTAMERIRTLSFTVDRVLWDPRRRELAIVYLSTIDGVSKHVSENLVLGVNGLVTAAEVFHGATVST
jgi:ketosteroid isomerase-like protein